MKIYIKQTQSQPQKSIPTLLWEAILARKIMMISVIMLIIVIPIALRVGDPDEHQTLRVGDLPDLALRMIIFLGTHYLYLLKSLKDGNYYIGQTENVKERLKKHNDGEVRSTKSRRPFVLIGYEEYQTKNEARWREYRLKHHSDQKQKFIESLLKHI
jgi:putative endonuclease